jgi:hypothetical protein
MILIFNKFNPEKSLYAEWLPQQKLHILSTIEGRDFKCSPTITVETFNDYDQSGKVEFRAFSLLKDNSINCIIAGSEPDVLRAAILRDTFNLPGQSYESALAYRDKAIMKKYLKNKTISIAPYTILREYTDLFQFIQQHNYPIVIKPIAGSGGVKTYIIRNQEELDEVLQSDIIQYREHASKFLVEKFISGEMYHIDGIAINSEIIFAQPSCYINSCLGFQHQLCIGSYTINPSSNFSQRLVQLTQAAIKALPSPNALVFHAEIFHTPQNQLIFCEIASRAGGALIPDVIQFSRGINLLKESIKAQVPGYEFDSRQNIFYRPAGFILIPPNTGKILSKLDQINHKNIVSKKIKAMPGDDLKKATKAVDSILDILVSAESETLVHTILKDIEQQAKNKIEYLQN